MLRRKSFPWGKLIFFATTNTHKFKEANEVLREYGISAAMLKIKTLEVQADDIEVVAMESASEAFKKCCLPLIVEDAGLFIDALNNFPGPYSSYVYRTIGIDGILKLLEGNEERKARFRSVVAFCDHKGNLKCFHGVAEGRITKKPMGSSGFGFDPIFEPFECVGKTFGEMSIKEKNRFSHRAQALRSFARWYKSEFESRI